MSFPVICLNGFTAVQRQGDVHTLPTANARVYSEDNWAAAQPDP